MQKENNLDLETLRGLACFLLVFGHLIGYPVTSGLRLDEGNGFHLFNLTLEHTRMPLFAFLGGVVFSFRGITPGVRPQFIKGKAIRLILPLIFVGPLFLYIQNRSGLANSGSFGHSISYYISVLWMHRAHYWFLQAMFLVFFFYLALSFLVQRSIVQYLTGFVLGSIGLIFFPSDVYVFSLSGFIFLLPFFSFGALVGALKIDHLKSNTYLKFVLVAMFATFAFVKFGSYGDDDYDKVSIFGLVFSLLSCSMLYLLGVKSKALIFIGHFSFSIYLYHVFFLAAARALLTKMGIEDVYIFIFCGLLAGIFGPVLAHYVFSRFNLTSLAFLGQKKRASASDSLESDRLDR